MQNICPTSQLSNKTLISANHALQTLFDSQHQTEVILFSWPVWLTRHWNEIGSMELASNTLQESWSSIMIGQCLVHYNIMESELVWQLRTIKVRGPAMCSQFWFGSWRLHIAEAKYLYKQTRCQKAWPSYSNLTTNDLNMMTDILI